MQPTKDKYYDYVNSMDKLIISDILFDIMKRYQIDASIVQIYLSYPNMDTIIDTGDISIEIVEYDSKSSYNWILLVSANGGHTSIYFNKKDLEFVGISHDICYKDTLTFKVRNVLFVVDGTGRSNILDNIIDEIELRRIK